MVRILLVDDELNVLAALSRILRHEWGDGATIETFNNPRAATDHASNHSYDVVISDYRMPEMDGIAFLTLFRAQHPNTARIILSASTDFDVLMAAVNDVGVSRFLAKPWDDAEVVKAVHDAVEATRKERDLSRLESQLDSGNDAALRAEAELGRLEELEPGITRVRWGPNGEVLLDDE